MGRHKVIPNDLLEHICEDYGLEELLLLNDIEPRTVLELLISEGLLDIESLCVELETDDDE
jgi:hypothetical protein